MPEHRPSRAAAPRPPSSRGALVLSLAGVAFGVIALGCGGGFDGGGGGGGGAAGEGPGRRSQELALSPYEELALGRKAFAEVKSQSEVLPEGRPEYRRVRDVAGGIIHQFQANDPLRREINLHLKDPRGEDWQFEWDYAVLHKDEVNAFCLPGGKIAVYTGLLEFVDKGEGDKDNAKLATVLSHEIAHALAHHANERIARGGMADQAMAWAAGQTLGDEDRLLLGKLMGAGTALADRGPDRGPDPDVLAGVAGKLGELAFDRRQEAEADHIGVFLMTFAGYDPDAAVRFWEDMAGRSKGHIPEILSDHPSDTRRVANLREWAARAKEALAAYKAGRIAPAGK